MPNIQIASTIRNSASPISMSNPVRQSLAVAGSTGSIVRARGDVYDLRSTWRVGPARYPVVPGKSVAKAARVRIRHLPPKSTASRSQRTQEFRKNFAGNWQAVCGSLDVVAHGGRPYSRIHLLPKEHTYDTHPDHQGDRVIGEVIGERNENNGNVKTGADPTTKLLQSELVNPSRVSRRATRPRGLTRAQLALGCKYSPPLANSDNCGTMARTGPYQQQRWNKWLARLALL